MLKQKCNKLGFRIVSKIKIYDFYESKGFMSDEDENAEVTIADDEIIDYAVSMAKKDSLCKLTPEQIEAIIEGELSYCESIGMFK